jgi:DNA modification methylase
MTFEITRTELVWPGKYDDEGNLNVSPRVNLPFQIVERVNETRATREARVSKVATLFDVWEGADEGESFDDGWRNKLIWGDNKLVMESLLDQFAGKVDLIYIDPPFAVGSDFSLEVKVGDDAMQKQASVIEEIAYRDTWGKGDQSYISMIHSRLALLRDLLTDNGSIYVHVDPRMVSQVRLVLDEIFGAASFQREIVWRIGWISGYKSAANNWIRNHDNILYYVKNPSSFTFNKEYLPYPAEYVRRDGSRPSGKGYPIEDVWNASPLEHALEGNESLDSIQIKSFSSEKTGYATQKNESLLRRIIQASSNPGDLVLDVFAGSGTTLAVSEKMGRRWIGADLGRFAIHTTRKRLLEVEDCKPFDILNLGKYERQFWSSVEFGEDLDGDGRIDLLEYISFILKLYGSSPLTGSQFLHGKFEKAFVHVGSVSSPITISEVEDALSECVGMSGKELHILGWEWEMGLIDTLTDYAKSKGVKLVARQIPREVMEAEAARKEQVSFYELAYLNVSFKEDKDSLSRTCELIDFMIPNPELIPDEVREKITKFSDFVDYWAVDWDFQNDTFMPAWMDYRTKQDRSLKLQTDTHTFAGPGTYKVMIKVVDIFGNDTSKVVEVKVS